MRIPKSKKKLRKFFIELRYLERNYDFSRSPIIYSYDLDLLSGILGNKTFERNGEYPHPKPLTPEERKDLWLATLPEEIRLDLSSVSDDDILECLEDKEWDATYKAAYGTKVIEFQEDHN